MGREEIEPDLGPLGAIDQANCIIVGNRFNFGGAVYATGEAARSKGDQRMAGVRDEEARQARPEIIAAVGRNWKLLEIAAIFISFA